jgi:RHS repeat-associated protein
VRATLVSNGGSYILTQGDQIAYTFNVSGSLTALVDSNANTTTLTYTGDNLTTITASNGLTLALTYDAQGQHITRLTDSLGRTAVYTCTPQGYLNQVSDFRRQVTTYDYDAAGHLRSITDANTHSVTNDYDISGRVLTQTNALGKQTTFAYASVTQTVVTDPNHHPTTYTYDDIGRLKSVTDALGKTTRYTYYDDHNLETVRDPLDRVTTYAWDTSGCKIASITNSKNGETLGVSTMTYDARHNLTSATDPRTHTTYFGYDDHDNLLVITNTVGATTTFTYNGYGQIRTSTDANRRATMYYGYDALGNLATITNTAAPYTVQMEYDRVGRLKVITDANQHPTRYDYDNGDLVTKVTDARDRETTYGYDKVGNLTAITDANHHPTTFSYYADDRLWKTTNALAKTTEYTYDDVGNLKSVKDATGKKVTYTYDGANRLEAAADDLGNTTRYGYNAVGSLTAITDANTIATHYEYDDLNRLERVVEAYGAGGSGPDRNVVTEYDYDAVGNRTDITDANGHVTHLTYDDMNRLETRSVQGITQPWQYYYDKVGNLTVITDAKGIVTHYVYDDLNRLTAIDYQDSTPDVSFGYDPVGNRTSMTDAAGSTTYIYDELNRLTSVVTHPGNRTVGYTYDDVGNLTQLDYPNSQGSVTYGYDNANRLTTVSGGLPSAVTYHYDDAGRLTGADLPNDIKSNLRYDAAGRLVCLSYGNSLSQALAGYRYTLDAVGNRNGAVESPGACIATYRLPIIFKNSTGGAGMLVPPGYNETFRSPLATPTQAATVTPTQEATAEPPAGTAEATPTQEPLPEVTPTIEAIEQATPTETPSAQPPLETATVEPSAQPPFGTGTALPTIPVTVTATLSAEPPVEAPTQEPTELPVLPLETVTATQTLSETAARVPGLAAPLLLSADAPAPAFDLLAWAWDGLNWLFAWLSDNVFTPGPVVKQHNLTEVAPLAFDSPIQGQSVDDTTVITYHYDNLYRLTSADYFTSTSGAESPVMSFAYTYDRVGNRTVQTQTLASTPVVTNYQYDTADRLTSVNGVAYTWDNNGNLTNDGIHTYTYDAANRLTAVGGLPSAVGYTYNGDGLLVSQNIGGTATTFTWDVAAGLPQVLAASSGARYIYGLGLLAQQQGGGWQYPLADGLGSVRHMTGPAGQSLSQYSFDLFGVPLSPSGGQPFGYAGEQWDANTNLIYLRARWYNPSLGRFLTRDPFPGMAALPGTQNPYAYVNNNPVNLTDPGGRIAPILIAAGVGATIGGVAGGAGYVLAHPGGRPEDYLQSGGFWRAVGVGALSGGVAGVVGFATGGLALGGGLGGAMVGGIVSGGLSGMAGQVTSNLLMQCPWHQGVLEAGISGGLIGGITGGLGYGIRRWPSSLHIDWSTYPQHPMVPKPEGPFRILEGAEYETARAQANAANRALHQANPSLQGFNIHEIHPVKFGGSPTDITNKVALTPIEHAQFTSWWNEVLRDLTSR